jgi:hypothetical protein
MYSQRNRRCNMNEEQKEVLEKSIHNAKKDHHKIEINMEQKEAIRKAIKQLEAELALEPGLHTALGLEEELDGLKDKLSIIEAREGK